MSLKSWYKTKYPHSYNIDINFHLPLYEHIRRLNPETVFEFGCNVGKNLNMLRQYKTHGIDTSERAIKQGKKIFNLNIETGDEVTIGEMSERGERYDVVFTVSTLCHIEETDKLIKDLSSIATHLFMYETKCKGWRFFDHDYPGDIILSRTPQTLKCKYNLYYVNNSCNNKL